MCPAPSTARLCESDRGKADETEPHPQESDTTRTERKSTLNKRLRLPRHKFSDRSGELWEREEWIRGTPEMKGTCWANHDQELVRKMHGVENLFRDWQENGVPGRGWLRNGSEPDDPKDHGDIDQSIRLKSTSCKKLLYVPDNASREHAGGPTKNANHVRKSRKLGTTTSSLRLAAVCHLAILLFSCLVNSRCQYHSSRCSPFYVGTPRPDPRSSCCLPRFCLCWGLHLCT